jgi:hypothetical protein
LAAVPPAAAEELRVPVIAHDDGEPAPAAIQQAAVGSTPEAATPSPAAKAEPTTAVKPTKARRTVTKHRRKPYRSHRYARRPGGWWGGGMGWN